MPVRTDSPTRDTGTAEDYYGQPGQVKNLVNFFHTYKSDKNGNGKFQQGQFMTSCE